MLKGDELLVADTTDPTRSVPFGRASGVDNAVALDNLIGVRRHLSRTFDSPVSRANAGRFFGGISSWSCPAGQPATSSDPRRRSMNGGPPCEHAGGLP